MKRIVLVVALLLAPSLSYAQCNGIFPNNTVCGNATGASNLPRPTNPSALQGSAGGTNGQVQYNNAGALAGESQVTLTQGGLGASQSAATANQVPVFPGSGGGAVPTSIISLINTVCGLSPTSCISLFGYVNPIWYGAKCDGVTHDEVAIQNALNASIPANVELRVPAGPACIANASITYSTASLFINVLIGGYGSTSQITFLGNTGFDFDAPAAYYRIHDLTINCSATSTIACVKIHNSHTASTSQSSALSSIISHVYIQSSGAYGFYFQNGTQTHFVDNTIITATTSTLGIGLYWDNSQEADVGDLKIDGNRIISNNATNAQGIYFLNVGGQRTVNNSVDGYLYDIYFLLTIASGAATGINMSNNQLDDFTTSGIWFTSNVAGGSIAHLNISGNVLHQKNTAASGNGCICIQPQTGGANWVLDALINSNTVDSHAGGSAILANGVTGLTINGNAIGDSGTTVGPAISVPAGSTNCMIIGNSVYQYTNHLSNAAGCATSGATN